MTCTKNFTRLNENCYLFVTNQEVNWKTANNVCRSYGAHLAELETLNENNDIIAHLLNHHSLNSYTDYWLGGLNPGLLWIWSSSGRPVNSNVNLTNIQGAMNETTKITPKISNATTTTVNTSSPEIEGAGRCLGIVYNRPKHIYKFHGVDCTKRQNFICEYTQDKIKKEISRLAKAVFG